MTMGTKIVFIITLIVSIIVPFGYYLLGEKSRKRYKRAIGTNAFFFFGAFAIASIMLLGGPNVQAAEAVQMYARLRKRLLRDSQQAWDILRLRSLRDFPVSAAELRLPAQPAQR